MFSVIDPLLSLPISLSYKKDKAEKTNNHRKDYEARLCQPVEGAAALGAHVCWRPRLPCLPHPTCLPRSSFLLPLSLRPLQEGLPLLTRPWSSRHSASCRRNSLSPSRFSPAWALS